MSPPPRRILIVRPSALGDVCRSVPILVSLKQAFPEASIDWVVRDGFEAAVAAHPMLDEVISFPREALGRWWRGRSAARAAWQWFGDLRRREYDLVVDVQGLGRSALITWATRAARRVGFRQADEFAWLAYTTRHPRPAGLHTVDEMLALIEADGVASVHDLRLYLASADEAWWNAQRPGASYTVVGATSQWASKRWPADRWAQLIAALRTRGHGPFVVVGAPGEEGQVETLLDAQASELINLVGKTSVGQTMAVIAGADLVIAHDSAPLHMAVGFDRPCVGLFGATDPARVGPYARPDAVIAANDAGKVRYRDRSVGDTLMRAITVDAVLAQLDRQVGPVKPASSVIA